ncbi:MAG: PorT family protein [Chitinophagaceae bacterium]|nr:MAG: PorT family protein [Chitinophagaceae bacterium]
MKKLLMIACLAATTWTAQAQRIRAGIEAGINFNSLRIELEDVDVDNGTNTGLKIGGIVDIPMSHSASFQPGLFYNVKGSENRFTNTYTVNNVLMRERLNQELKINYLEIPFNFQFRLNPRYRSGFFIGGGPYVGFAIGGEVEQDLTVRDLNGTVYFEDEDSYDLEIGDDEDEDDIRRNDFGVNLNLGYMGRQGFFVRGNMGVGLTNIIPGGDDDFSARNFTLGLSAGFLFGR